MWQRRRKKQRINDKEKKQQNRLQREADSEDEGRNADATAVAPRRTSTVTTDERRMSDNEDETRLQRLADKLAHGTIGGVQLRRGRPIAER